MKQIIVENLVKSFKVSKREFGFQGAIKGLFHRTNHIVKALDGIDFSIDQGELVGYIGPNGAGKSTTVKVLSGILVPDSGTCQVLGRTPWKNRVENVQNIGVVFGQRTQLWWDLPVIESFELLRNIYRIKTSEYCKTRDRLVDMLNLGGILNTPVRQLSLGQRMRCDLVASLLHAPDLIFLDEPTIGLDAVAKLAVREFVQELNQERGVTIMLTTHDMDDIESLCKRIMIIGHGKILFDDNLEQLRRKTKSERRLTVDLASPVADFQHPEVRVLKTDKNRLHLSFDPEKLPPQDLISQLTASCQIRDLFVESQPIEELIAQLYQDLNL